LTPLFNWNTKQVFVYLTAEYPGKRPDISNRVTFWDSIVPTKEDAVLKLENAKGKYPVYDVGQGFEERNATIHLEWNVQPHVGMLVYGDTQVQGFEGFTFPKVERK
jgi:signal peptidase complex subunit 3